MIDTHKNSLVQLFAQVRTSLDTLHYYGAAERHTDDDCPVCGSCDEGYDALSAIERHVQDMEKALRDIESLPSQSEHWHENDVAVTIARAALLARLDRLGKEQT